MRFQFGISKRWRIKRRVGQGISGKMKNICKNCKWHMPYNHRCGYIGNSNFTQVVDNIANCRDFKEKTTIIETIGKPALLEQLAEECSKLSQAALKLARKLRGENPTPKTFDECEKNLQEVMADLLLCVDEYTDHIASDFYIGIIMLKEQKRQRWKVRLSEAADEK